MEAPRVPKRRDAQSNGGKTLKGSPLAQVKLSA